MQEYAGCPDLEQIRPGLPLHGLSPDCWEGPAMVSQLFVPIEPNDRLDPEVIDAGIESDVDVDDEEVVLRGVVDPDTEFNAMEADNVEVGLVPSVPLS